MILSKRAAAGGGTLRPPEEAVREVYAYVLPLWAAGVRRFWDTPPPSRQEVQAMRADNTALRDALYDILESSEDPAVALREIEDLPWWEEEGKRPVRKKPFRISRFSTEDGSTALELMIGDSTSSHIGLSDRVTEEEEREYRQDLIRDAINAVNRADDRLDKFVWRRSDFMKNVEMVRELAVQDAEGEEVELPSVHERSFMLPSGKAYSVKVKLDPKARDGFGCLKSEPKIIFELGRDFVPVASPTGYEKTKEELFGGVEHEMVHVMQRHLAQRKGLPGQTVGLPPLSVRTPPEGEAWKQPEPLKEPEFYPYLFAAERELRRQLAPMEPEQRWSVLEKRVGLGPDDPYAPAKDDPLWFFSVLRKKAPSKWQLAMKHLLTQLKDLLLPKKQASLSRHARLIEMWEQDADDDKYFGLEIRKSPIHGLGLFATESFKEGDTICKALRKVRSTGIADFDLLQTRWGRKLNHEDEPNARPVLEGDSSDVLVVATKKIKEGDEITVNYEEFGDVVGRVAEDLSPQTLIEVSPGQLETAMNRRRRSLADIISLAPHIESRAVDDAALVDLKKHGIETEEDRKILLDKAAAKALAEAQADLPEGHSFCVFNGFRSQKDQERVHKATERMLKKTHPASWRKLVKKYMGDIADSNPMSHRSGTAIDVKILKGGKELDLGGMKMDEQDRLDYFEVKVPSRRQEVVVKENRRLLKEILEKHGFKNNPDEWWHWGYAGTSKTAASMRHPGPTWGPHISTMPFMTARKDKPPGFKEEWDFEKDGSYNWMEGGTFQSPARLLMPPELARYLDGLARRLGWSLDIANVGDGKKEVMIGREVVEVPKPPPPGRPPRQPRRLRLGKFLPKLMKKVRKEGTKQILAWLQRKNETSPPKNEWMLIVSAEPSDLRSISTDRGWTSCMTLKGEEGDPKRALESSIEARDLVAYAVDKTGKWLARLVLRFDGVGGWWPEAIVYGQPSSIDFDHFRQVVDDWIDKKGIRGEEGRISPMFEGWSDKKKAKYRPDPTPEEVLQKELELQWMRGEGPPESYRGHGRPFVSPFAGGRGIAFMVYFKKEPDLDPELDEVSIAENAAQEARTLEEQNPEMFRLVRHRHDLPGFPSIIDVLSYEGIFRLRKDPAIERMYRISSASSALSLRTYPPLSQRDGIVRVAGRRLGVDEEYIWLWDSGMRKGKGMVSSPRLHTKKNVEGGQEIKGVEHRMLSDEAGMSPEDAHEAPRGFVTYNEDDSIDVTTYGTPFEVMLHTDERAYNAVEKAFGLLPGGYKQVVLPMQRGSWEALMELPKELEGDADDGGYDE